ncbi:MAG: peptidoglycan-binding protein [Rubrivivax sp.]|nr:peptidoglycan-binding protein [Rubrivivax sp.]MBK8527104.1 peptidoglycan-binding protein [Rubrivivax sp.]
MKLRSIPRQPRQLLMVLPLCALLSLAAAAAQPTITFVDGSGTLLSGGRAYQAAAGVRLRSCDALRTGPQAMVQVEFDDGSAILLGPDSRFVFDLPESRASGEGANFLHSGWVKLSAPKRAGTSSHRILTPQFDLSLDTGVAVLHIAAAGSEVYVERGEAVALEPAATPPARTTVGTGYTYARKVEQARGTLSRGVDPGFARALPRTLRDTLPMLLTQLKTRDVRARPAPDGGTSAAEGWLASAPELRACTIDDRIRKAQQFLISQGFDVGAIDGVLGARTQAALRSFQQLQGLPSSGQLDAATQRALDDAANR